MRHLRFNIFIIFILTILQSFSEKKFYVIDEHKKPVENAILSLLSGKDSTLIESSLTNIEGYGTIRKQFAPEDLLDISSIGFKSYREQISEISDTIKLCYSSTILDDIVVVGKKDILKNNNGKFIFTPNSLKDEVSTSLDVVRFTPLIESNDGQISILGKGSAKILINGRESKLDDSATISRLKSTPAVDVKRIEVIPNAGSSQNASDARGIVNIILDEPDKGFKGTSNITASYQGERLSPAINFWGMYSHKKIKIESMVEYRYSNSYRKGSLLSIFPPQEYSALNNTKTNRHSNIIGGYISSNFKFSDKSEAGLSLGLSTNNLKEVSDVNSNLRYFNGIETTEAFSTLNQRPFNRPTIKIIGYWNLKTDSKGSNFDITADFFNSESKSHTDYFYNNIFSSMERNNVTMTGGHLKPKYSLIINKRHSINVGYEFSYQNNKYNNEASTFSSNLKYTEIINSAFTEWRAVWNGIFSSSLGLRVENSKINETEFLQEKHISQNYTDLFPNASLNISLPKGNQFISLNISKSIFRPFYDDLNPAIAYTSGNSYITGNPNLKPQYTWDFNILYNWLNDFTAYISYKHQKNSIYQYLYNIDGYSVSSIDNVGSNKAVYGYISYAKLLFGIWHLKATANIHYDITNGEIHGNDLSYKSLYGSLNLINNIVFSKNHKFSCLIIYNLYSPLKSLTSDTRWQNSLSLILSKGFNNGLNIQLLASNLLFYRKNQKFNSKNYSYERKSLEFPMTFSLSLQYVFGKKSIRSANSRTYTETEMRIK